MSSTGSSRKCSQDTLLEDIYKLIVVGDSGTGKTHIVHNFTKQTSSHNLAPTIGFEYTSKIISIDQKTKIRAQIWDTAGQQKFRSLTVSHYRKSVGALIVFDLTNRNTFKNLDQWLHDVLEKADPDVQIVVLGHKCDQLQRQVERWEGEQYASRNKVWYMETTVNGGESIGKAFSKLCQNIMSVKKREVVGIKLNRKQILKEQHTVCIC